MRFLLVLLTSLLVTSLYQSPAIAEPASRLEKADGPELASAIGHYARARSLLIAAIREFDSGMKYADPSSLIDTLAWRNSLTDRAEDLEHILAPQPRVSQSGIQYQADSRLISEAYKK